MVRVISFAFASTVADKSVVAGLVYFEGRGCFASSGLLSRSQGAAPRDVVSFQWADAFHQGWIKTRVCHKRGPGVQHSYYLRVEYSQGPEARPANVAIRPLDGMPLRVLPRSRF